MSETPLVWADPKCPTFMIQSHAATDLYRTRSIALRSFGQFQPGFDGPPRLTCQALIDSVERNGRANDLTGETMQQSGQRQ